MMNFFLVEYLWTKNCLNVQCTPINSSLTCSEAQTYNHSFSIKSKCNVLTHSLVVVNMRTGWSISMDVAKFCPEGSNKWSHFQYVCKIGMWQIINLLITFVFLCACKEGASYTYTMVSFNIYFFILNNTINILQTNIGLVELQVHHFLSTSHLWTWLLTNWCILMNETWTKDHVTLPNYNNKRENFTVSCIQIGFNASKDIQEWMATVNLNLLT